MLGLEAYYRDIFEISYGSAGQGQVRISGFAGAAVVAQITGLVKLAGFYTSAADPYSRRVQALSQDNATFDIAEIRYSPANGIVINPVLQSQDAVDIAGFYSPDDGFSHCIAALRSGVVSEIFYRP